VVEVQFCNLSKAGLDQGQCQWNHRVNYGQMEAAPGLSWYWRPAWSFRCVNQVCMHLGKGFVRTLWKEMEAAGAIFWRGFANYCLNVFSKLGLFFWINEIFWKRACA
jgi:hypothetical protein